MWFKRKDPTGSLREGDGNLASSLQAPRSVSLQEAIEELQDGFRRLERRFDRLQGELSRSVRRQAELERENDDLRADLDDARDYDEEDHAQR